MVLWLCSLDRRLAGAPRPRARRDPAGDRDRPRADPAHLGDGAVECGHGPPVPSGLRRDARLCQGNIELADQLGMVQLRAWASIHKGWALACGGEIEAGLAEIEAGLATWRAIGGLNNRTHFLNLLAEVCRLAGRPEAGMAALDEAEDISRTVDLHAHDVETRRRRGELFLTLGKVDEAEAAWLRALEVARCQVTRTLELRAATDLACLWAEHGRRAEAHGLLAPIYNWFTEGFDTADLKDAKALLDQMA